MNETAKDVWLARTKVDPNKPRDEDLEFARAHANKVWQWMIDEYVKDSQFNQIAVNAVKIQFPVISVQIVGMCMNILVDEKKIELSSSEKSRNITYKITKLGLEEIEEEAANIVAERKLDQQLKEALAEKAKAEKAALALTKKRSLESTNNDSSTKENGEMNNANAHNNDRISQRGTQKKAKSSFGGSSSSSSSISNSNSGTSAGGENTMMMMINTVELNNSPLSKNTINNIYYPNNNEISNIKYDIIKEIIQHAFENSSDGIPISDILQMKCGGDGSTNIDIDIDNDFNINEIYSALEHLSFLEKVLVDWDENDKPASMIYNI
jgi:hypothetical protein